jgi:hypothetical protein
MLSYMHFTLYASAMEDTAKKQFAVMPTLNESYGQFSIPGTLPL